MKSKFQKIIDVILIMICIGGFGYFIYYGMNVQHKNSKVEHSEQAEPLTITTPTVSHDGTVSVYESDGSICFQYVGGNIDVLNDGKNGEDVNVEVHKLGEPDSCGSDGELPTHLILYDHTNHKVISYVGFPKIEDGILIIDDATVTYEEGINEDE